jgi:BirA family biotin operon repressor/biotin-[acetyl-CoA-carboxylase] ligase
MTNTLFIGKVYYHFDELSSTNDWAQELIAKSKPSEGTVVRADTQTAGRGQFGSRWVSPPRQNLLLSIILHPHWLAIQDQWRLSMAVALAVHDAIQLPDASIKWPNDIYLRHRKTAGILIQNTLNGAYLQTAIVGIGINVNQLVFDPFLPNPTSLAAHTGGEVDMDALLNRLYVCLEQRYLQLKSGKTDLIRDDYTARLFQKSVWAQFVRLSDDTPFDGMILGVTDAGHLQVQLRDGTVETFDLKAVRLVV